MRVNFEEEELSSHSLKKMAHLLSLKHELMDFRRLAIGYLIDLWHQAINDNKRSLTAQEIMDCLCIYDDNETGLEIIKIMEKSGYLMRQESMYCVVGKDKDFAARESFIEKGRKGGEKKAENQKIGLAPATKKLAPARKNVAQASDFLPNSIQFNSDQFNTIQIRSDNTKLVTVNETPQIVSAPAPGTLAIAPVRRKKNERSEAEKERARKFKDVFVEHYEKAMNGAKPPWGPKEFTIIYEIISTYSIEDLSEMVSVYFVTRPSNSLRDGYPLVGYGSSFKSLAAQLYADIKNPGRRILAKNNEKSFDEHMKIQEKLNLINNRKLV